MLTIKAKIENIQEALLDSYKNYILDADLVTRDIIVRLKILSYIPDYTNTRQTFLYKTLPIGLNKDSYFICINIGIAKQTKHFKWSGYLIKNIFIETLVNPDTRNNLLNLDNLFYLDDLWPKELCSGDFEYQTLLDTSKAKFLNALIKAIPHENPSDLKFKTIL